MSLSESRSEPNNENNLKEHPDQEQVLIENSSGTTKKSFAFYLTFLALNISVFISSLDATALAVAIPKITKELQGTTLEAYWTSLSFLLAVVVAQPIYTSASDVIGRKIPFFTAFLLFFAGSLVFALGKNMATLIGGRLLQGLGGGGLDVLSEVILVDITSLKERPLYLGLFSLPMAGGAVCGPLVGAAFSEFVDWRWIGWVNLPFAAVGAALTIFFLRLRSINRSFGARLRRLDWTGMLLFAIGSVAFSLPLSWAGAMYPWSSWKTIVPFFVGIVTLVVFAFYESKPAEPIFPYRIFSNRTAAISVICGTIHGMVMYSGTFYLPLYFQAIMLETPFKSAISILPSTASTIGFSVISALAVEKFRRYRWMIIIAWVFGSCGVGLWALTSPSSQVSLTAGLQVVLGVGIGTLFTILTIPMQASVEDIDDSGIAAGILVSFRLFGGLVGLAICAGIFNNIFEQRIASIEHLPLSAEGLRDNREIISLIPGLKALDLEPEMLRKVIEAYRRSFEAVFLTLAGMGAIGFASSLFMKEISLEREDMGRQRFEASA